MAIKIGDVMEYRGRVVRVIDVDSDPTCAVWVVSVDDVGADMMVMRDELAEVA